FPAPQPRPSAYAAEPDRFPKTSLPRSRCPHPMTHVPLDDLRSFDCALPVSSVDYKNKTRGCICSIPAEEVQLLTCAMSNEGTKRHFLSRKRKRLPGEASPSRRRD